MNIFHSAFGDLKLARWPQRKSEKLQAWDAADEHLLNHLAEQDQLTQALSGRVLIVNDAHGALSCALHTRDLTNWSDSFISQTAARQNLQLNRSRDADFVRSTESLQGNFDLVLIKVPKTNALLEDQLIRLRNHIDQHTIIIAAAMIKHLQRSAFDCIEKTIGPLTTSLAVKKSRLIFTRLNPELPQMVNPYPTFYNDPDIGLTLTNHANLFSRDHLDLGARFFLSVFSEIGHAEKVLDLACGNGVLGIMYQQLHSSSQLNFIDESYMAVESARLNFQAAFADNHADTVFIPADGLNKYEAKKYNLILCNPPFHQQHAVGDQIALNMFRNAKRCLVDGGDLWVVSNHHLAYKAKLHKLFGNCRSVSKNKKFVVLHANKKT